MRWIEPQWIRSPEAYLPGFLKIQSGPPLPRVSLPSDPIHLFLWLSYVFTERSNYLYPPPPFYRDPGQQTYCGSNSIHSEVSSHNNCITPRPVLRPVSARVDRRSPRKKSNTKARRHAPSQAPPGRATRPHNHHQDSSQECSKVPTTARTIHGARSNSQQISPRYTKYHQGGVHRRKEGRKEDRDPNTLRLLRNATRNTLRRRTTAAACTAVPMVAR